MLRNHVLGSAAQALMRTRTLQDIVLAHSRAELRDLQRICAEKLKGIAAELEEFNERFDQRWIADQAAVVRSFKLLSTQLALIERGGVFALIHASDDDAFLNRLVQMICQEINYPVIAPTVSHSSPGHFRIDREYHLLSVPPIESRFLLHLPDLYHELAHPLFSDEHRRLPSLKPLTTAFTLALFERNVALDASLRRVDRREGPEQGKHRLNVWRLSWTPSWMEEFFSDLFAVYLVGPAFVWSHYHLYLIRGNAPFETPRFRKTTHPADGARMQVMLMALNTLGFTEDAKAIDLAWMEILTFENEHDGMDFKQCFPPNVLNSIVDAALTAFAKIGLTGALPGQLSGIALCLNQAWDAFWVAPVKFPEWESAAIEHLRSSI